MRLESCCEKESSRTNEKKSIQRRADHRDSLRSGEDVRQRYAPRDNISDVNEALRLPALEDENIRFNNLVADQAVQISILKEVNSKSGKPVVGNAAIENVLEQGKGATADTSRAFGPQRSTYYHNSSIIPERQKIGRTIVGLSEDHPRYGYRRITVAMRGGVDQCKAGSKGAPPLWTAGS